MTTFTLGQHIQFDGHLWRIDNIRGFPGMQKIDLRDTADGRHCQTWKAGILADLIRRGW